MTSRFFFQLLSLHPPEDIPPRKSSKEAVGIEEATVASDGSHKGLAHTPSVTYDKYSHGICTHTCMRVRGTLCQVADQCSVFVMNNRGGVSLILSGLLKLLDIIFVRGALCALLSVVGRPGLIIPAPVALADNPGQDVHFVVELR